MSHWGDILRLQQKLQNQLETRRVQRIQFRGLMGDGNGNVQIPDMPGYVYVRREGRSTIQHVWNVRCPLADGLPILCGYSDEFPERLQVLSISWGSMGWAMPSGGTGGDGTGGILVDHHSQHEWGGHDVVWSSIQQITDGLIKPPTSGGVAVDQLPCIYSYLASFYYKAGEQDFDISAHVPTDVGTARWVLISIDTTVDPHALQATAGTAFPYAMFPPDVMDSMPDAPVGSIPLAGVYLREGDTQVLWEDIYDMRLFPTGVTGVTTPTAHELMYDDVHSDVDGDNDPSAGDLIMGNAAGTLWTVLALGARGGIPKVNAGADALEYLASGGAGAVLVMDAAGNDPQWLAIGARGAILKVNAAGTQLENLAVGAADEVLKSDGTDPAWANVGHDELTDINDDDHHDPITLGAAEIQAVLDLAAQVLTLDTQTENEFFAGPTAAPAAKPVFRAITAADIEDAIATGASGAARIADIHTHVHNEDLSARVDGAETVFDLANEAMEETTQVYEDGVRMRLNDDYTETDMGNSITFTNPPGGGSEIWVDYVPVT